MTIFGRMTRKPREREERTPAPFRITSRTVELLKRCKRKIKRTRPRHPDPFAFIYTFPRPIYSEPIKGLRCIEDIEERPIEEHPNFNALCRVSAWQRERVVRGGGAWVDDERRREAPPGASKGIS